MAKIGLKFSKMNGSTLVETLVAFTVLLICVSIAAMFIARVAQSKGKFDYLEGWITMQNLALKTNQTMDFTSKELSYNHFRIRRTVKPSSYTPSIFVLELKVIDQDNRIRLFYKSLILPDHALNP